jgi:hypothetical protein
MYLSFTNPEFAALRACAKRVLQIGVAEAGIEEDSWPQSLCDLRDAISVMDGAFEDFQATESEEE